MSGHIKNAAANVDSTPFSAVITMSPETVSSLLANNFWLYGFKGVDGPGSPGKPLVWFKTNQFSAATVIEWTEQYAGYTSTSTNIAAGTQVNASFSVPMSLGQLLTVGQGGVGPVTNNGDAGEITILSQVTTPLTCGVSVLNQTTGQMNPICAFPLFGGGEDQFVPIELVYFTFATSPENTGTVIEQTFAPGILVDMTGITTPAPLTFDINAGWTGPGFTRNLPAGQDLPPLLINAGGVAAVSRREAQRRRKRIAA